MGPRRERQSLMATAQRVRSVMYVLVAISRASLRGTACPRLNSSSATSTVHESSVDQTSVENEIARSALRTRHGEDEGGRQVWARVLQVSG